MSDLDLYNDLVDQGRRARGAGDAARWLLGDLAVRFCREFGIDPKAGRPPAGSDTMTLVDYARQIDVNYHSLSDYRLTADFYPDNLRRHGDYATWVHHNRARRASAGSLDSALELLEQAATLHLGADDFDRYVKGEWFAGPVDWAELPARLQEAVPPGRKVRCVLTAWRDESG